MLKSVRAVTYGSGNRGAAPAPSGTPFDIGTTTTPITSKVIINTGNTYSDLTWGDSGSKVYIVNDQGHINQYAAGTPYDVTTIVDTGSPASYDVTLEDTIPGGIAFKPDGTRMYICGTADVITQYTLSPAWDVTSAGNIQTKATEFNNWVYTGLHFNPTGTKLYMVMGGASGYIITQTLGTAWDITTLSAGGGLVNISTDTTSPQGIHLSDDGTLLQVSSNGFGEDFVFQYLLSTPFDENSAGLDFTYDSSVLDGAISGITFDPTGYIMYLYGSANESIYQIPLTG